MENEPQVMKKVTISIDEKLWDEFDSARIRARYSTRSSAVAEAVRDFMAKIDKRK
jgi:metal-responsive CopG/Arc/MetJ family transcriptional regulator